MNLNTTSSRPIKLAGALLLRAGCLILFLFVARPACAAEERFYLGTYTSPSASQGIYVGTLDSETGKLGPIRLAAAVKQDPTFLALSPHGSLLFAALSDAVACFRVEPNGLLRAINRQPSGLNTCHVSLDRTAHMLFAASYDTGSISSYPVAGGRIGARSASIPFTGSGPDTGRQLQSHPHSVYADPEDHFLYVCDLGADRIWIFRLGAKGQLIPADPPAAIVAPGSGPRHLAFSPDGSLVYVANELGVTTTVFSRNKTTGELTLVDTENNIEPGWPHGTGSGEISLHPSGKWLYVSTRLTDRMTVFKINPEFPANGAPLQREQVIPSPVKFPRSFALDPTGRWLIVAGQTANRIAVMKVDAATGQLAPTSAEASVGSPVCVLFAPVSR